MKNKTENKIDHLKAAAQLIDKANDELQKYINATNDTSKNDAAHYKYELAELLSCDNSECGLLHLIKILENK
jgi:phosphoheptose isomerase